MILLTTVIVSISSFLSTSLASPGLRLLIDGRPIEEALPLDIDCLLDESAANCCDALNTSADEDRLGICGWTDDLRGIWDIISFLKSKIIFHFFMFLLENIII